MTTASVLSIRSAVVTRAPRATELNAKSVELASNAAVSRHQQRPFDMALETAMWAARDEAQVAAQAAELRATMRGAHNDGTFGHGELEAIAARAREALSRAGSFSPRTHTEHHRVMLGAVERLLARL